MLVDIRQVDSVIVVDLSGALNAGVGEELLRDVMNELIAANWKKILLNLSDVPRIDSAGIGELVASIRLAERFGTVVRLVHVKGRVRDVLEIGQILPLLDVYESEEAALANDWSPTSSFGDP